MRIRDVVPYCRINATKTLLWGLSQSPHSLRLGAPCRVRAVSLIAVDWGKSQSNRAQMSDPSEANADAPQRNAPLQSELTGLIDRALALHQAGRAPEAEGLYRAIIEKDPANADAVHLLGVLAHQRGEHVAATELIKRAIALRPNVAMFHSNLGEALRAHGQVEAAIHAYETAIRLRPDFADAYGNLGAALVNSGHVEEAIEALSRAIRIDPHMPGVQMNLGYALRGQGRLTEAAVCFRQALASRPDFAEAHVNLANVLKELRQPETAITHYHEAMRIRPELIAAHLNLGNLLLEQERYAEARDSYHRAFEIGHGDGSWATGPFTPPPTGGAISAKELETTPFELINRAEHIEYLLATGKVDRSFTELAALYRSAIREIAASEATRRITLSAERAARLLPCQGRVIHYADAPRVAPCAVNEGLDFRRIEDGYLSSPVSVVHFDDFLTPQALRRLQNFCLDSTIFFGRDRAGTLQSYIGDGFDCSLLFQVVEELKQRFPRILGKQVLRNMWAYRYPSKGDGVNLHTDNGAVTFNFWITPDDANLVPQGSGLVVYPKEQPLDWDWTRINRDKDDPRMQRDIRQFLGLQEPVRIPYRENRAVLFHSNLFHQSDYFRFKDGYRNRRMNVTLLFGDRGTDVRMEYLAAQ